MPHQIISQERIENITHYHNLIYPKFQIYWKKKNQSQISHAQKRNKLNLHSWTRIQKAQYPVQFKECSWIRQESERETFFIIENMSS